jgi:hypothetical protein
MHDDQGCGRGEHDVHLAHLLSLPNQCLTGGELDLLTAVENGGAGRSKMVALGGVDLP